MKLIFDFDDVIYDTKKFKEKVFALLEKEGVHDVEKVYAEYREKHVQFSLLPFLQHTLGGRASDVEVKALYEEVTDDSEVLLDQEVMSLIAHVGPHNCYIVSQGDREWQEIKIERSVGNIGFMGVYVVPESKKEVIEMLCRRHGHEEVIFVDDKVANCNEVVSDKTPNLKTVVYNHHGLENLKAEIEASKEEERERAMREQEEEIKVR